MIERLFRISLLVLVGLIGAGNRVVNQVAGGGAVPFSQTLDTDGTTEIGCGLTGRKYVGAQFTSSNTGTVTSIQLHGYYVGTPGSYTFNCEIWSDDGGAENSAEPDVLLSNGSVQFDLSSAPSSIDDFTITYPTGPSLVASTKYWIVIKANQTIDNTNYLKIIVDGAESLHDLRGSSTGADTDWAAIDWSAYLRGVINGTE